MPKKSERFWVRKNLRKRGLARNSFRLMDSWPCPLDELGSLSYPLLAHVRPLLPRLFTLRGWRFPILMAGAGVPYIVRNRTLVDAFRSLPPFVEGYLDLPLLANRKAFRDYLRTEEGNLQFYFHATDHFQCQDAPLFERWQTLRSYADVFPSWAAIMVQQTIRNQGELETLLEHSDDDTEFVVRSKDSIYRQGPCKGSTAQSALVALYKRRVGTVTGIRPQVGNADRFALLEVVEDDTGKQFLVSGLPSVPLAQMSSRIGSRCYFEVRGFNQVFMEWK